jgi:hypothetical protein
LLTAYFLALVYFHDAATVAADWLKYQLTLKYYNLFFLLSGLFISTLATILLLRKIIANPERKPFFFYFMITVLAMLVAVLTMTVVNMEAIHFIQYAILAALALPLARRYEKAFIITTVLGIIDEIYQYLVLNPGFSYFDFNDIILNMLGAGAGLLILAIIGFPQVETRPWRWYSSPAFWFIVLVWLAALILSLGLRVSFYPPAGGAPEGFWFSLYRTNLPDEFWTFLYDKRYYHILRPWEAISLMTLLTLFYSSLDTLFKRLSRQ